jgi:diadenosine tetraphosphatase ApaH/serine/threonine PP2A family protein phosphatase
MPRIALISDIHGNIDALKAVLADIERQEIDEILCLGDIVGYGAAPAECLSLVRERCALTLMGNHDEYLVKDPDNFVLSKRIREPLLLAKTTLSPGDFDWLSRRPFFAERHGFTIVHASLAIAPESFNYLNTDMVAGFHFDQQTTPVCFVGHTHRPEMVTHFKNRIGWGLLWEGESLLDRSKRCAVNVGSVGQPRDDNPMAAYGIYHTDINSFTLRRISYDVDMAIQRIRESGLPEENALRLLKGK